MRKYFIKAIIAVLLAPGLLSCSKSDQKQYFPNIPEEVQAEFAQRFPNAKNIEWEYKANVLKAEFVLGKVEHEAWWEKSTGWNWFRTEKDLKASKNQLPSPVQNYLASNYPGWRIDDVDFVQTPSSSYYEIDIEKTGELDVTIFIKEDGTLLYSFIDDDLDHSYITAASVPQAVLDEFNKRYAKAFRIDWEKKGELYEVDFILDYKKHEAFFSADGTWLRTEIDLPLSAVLPQAIKDYITANYSGWRIDDIDLVQTPGDEFYSIELEKKGQPDTTILIHENGSLVTL